jgi:2-oxopent-4-enoate/cis-2-oxohex-4-enoate hydratase
VSIHPTSARKQHASRHGAELFEALRTRRTVEPLTEREPALTVDDAYEISLDFLRRRLALGERVIGKKIGITSKAVQAMLGVHQPDFGFLTDAMRVPDADTIEIGAGLIQPRVEAEIGLVLRSELRGPNIEPRDVLDATAAVAPCFEVVDSRIRDWKIRLVDTIADNASCGMFVMGPARIDPRQLDLAQVRCEVFKNGAPLSSGYGSAVQGSPLASVAWLANTLHRYGVVLEPGEIILSGALVPLEPARPGDYFETRIEGIGTSAVRFR